MQAGPAPVAKASLYSDFPVKVIFYPFLAVVVAVEAEVL